MIENTIIEIDAEDENLMLYLFDSGLFGDIETDEQKIEVITHILTGLGWPNYEAEIRMCAKWFLNKIKEDTELCDAEIMMKLGKAVSKEIKERWL